MTQLVFKWPRHGISGSSLLTLSYSCFSPLLSLPSWRCWYGMSCMISVVQSYVAQSRVSFLRDGATSDSPPDVSLCLTQRRLPWVCTGLNQWCCEDLGVIVRGFLRTGNIHVRMKSWTLNSTRNGSEKSSAKCSDFSMKTLRLPVLAGQGCYNTLSWTDWLKQQRIFLTVLEPRKF